LPKSRHEVRDRGRRTGVQPPDNRHCHPLRPRRKRSRCRRAPEKSDELAPLVSGKAMELLKEIVPRVTRVTVAHR
jgi:hypothetical protein